MAHTGGEGLCFSLYCMAGMYICMASRRSSHGYNGTLSGARGAFRLHGVGVAVTGRDSFCSSCLAHAMSSEPLVVRSR
jgi:hypothetical protein